MFNDRFRLLKIIIPLFIIVLLVIYARKQGPLIYPGYKEARKNPDQFIGKTVRFGGTILKVSEGYFTVKIEKQEVKVLGNLPKEKVGYSIAGEAVYLENGVLEMLDYHVSNLRKYKIFISLFPLTAIIYLFLREFRFNRKRFTFIRKESSTSSEA